ncbi:hypothetical protein SS50377_22892 [Spironucleus salmonicida]|uniref:Uncharacterized protein n=1 Tax=Spironucleus salmonicida TaxID=348837 RepID=A0A9P8LVZ6_9EUKA|nr:hypothetical protein SS50377_22892 [Spironucleus salmonicida]
MSTFECNFARIRITSQADPVQIKANKLVEFSKAQQRQSTRFYGSRNNLQHLEIEYKPMNDHYLRSQQANSHQKLKQLYYQKSEFVKFHSNFKLAPLMDHQERPVLIQKFDLEIDQDHFRQVLNTMGEVFGDQGMENSEEAKP